MSTKKNTGVRNHNTNMAPAAAGSGVTVNPSADPVATSPVAGTTPAAAVPTTGISESELLGAEDGAKIFRDVLSKALADLRTALGVFPSPEHARVVAVSGLHKEAAGLYAGLLRAYPDLTTTVSAGAIDAGLAVSTALAMVKSDLQEAMPLVEYCGRQAAQVSWADAKVVRFAAKGRIPRDKVLAAKVVAIDATLRRGKDVTTTANTAATAQAKAVKTQQRAAAAVAKAQAKAARATRIAERAAQAHADNHPTTPDVVIVPAGTTEPNGTPPKG